ncbi:hypothetical protein [Mycobacterium sp. 236(2023)]|uniref:hypothetical protein n=1 Tax=Mycobacterium sp. 236(2023) TaxID=3038163 RepID=UPI00241548F2|nr:hypothetical protein [Mycobacterium sp. 236(2023)]MDG4668636.1 hypothetical protein [Mycobacterium sp. 236(2023)]
MRVLLLAVVLSVTAGAGCSSATTPASDDEQVRELYAEYRDAAVSQDADKLRELQCPDVDLVSIALENAENFGPVTSTEETDQQADMAPKATAWRWIHATKATGSPSTWLAVRIDDKWMMCG